MLAHRKEIIELLEAPEGDHYEFKEAKTRYGFDEAVQYCCAIANCGGGQLVLGITNNRPREVVGSLAFPQPERTRENLMDKLNIRVDFQILYDPEGRRILVFEVASRPIGLPVHADGIPWWRRGDSLVPMPPEVLHRIYEETGHDFTGDVCLGATLQDLDVEAINDFRRRWFEKSGNKRINSMTVEQLLIDCEAISDDGVTYAALILFGTRKALGKYLSQAEVVFEYRSSVAAGPAQQREDFRVGFFLYYDKVWDLVDLRNDNQNYQDGLFVLDIPTFNERVVRESLLNAVSHRNYQLGGNIFIRQYSDKIVIESPGGLPIGISAKNIINKQSRRNRRIADIFALCGLIERSGQGMNLIYELNIREAKPLPDFTGTDDYSVFLTLNGIIQDKKMILLIKRIGEETLEKFITEDFLIIDTLFHGRKLTDELRSRIKHLSEMGIVEHKGHGKYVIAHNLFESVGKNNTHSRLVGKDREVSKEQIFSHIKSSGANGIQLNELLLLFPRLSKDQIKNLLRDLRREKRVEPEGKANKARWHVI